jgi:hypothetical protein
LQRLRDRAALMTRDPGDENCSIARHRQNHCIVPANVAIEVLPRSLPRPGLREPSFVVQYFAIGEIATL